jgi:hypothetical protein
MKTQRHLVVLSDGAQERLREVLADQGEGSTAETMGVSRIALLRGASGLGVLRGTKALITEGLDDLEDADDVSDDDDLEDADDVSDDDDLEDADDVSDDDLDA